MIAPDTKSEMTRPKYSLVIPALNSLNFLKMTIPTVLNNDYQDFELIVSDNLSDDQTFEYLHKLQDIRLRIVRPDIRLSMSEHYEFALSNARGEWVNLLGADDVPLPSIFSDMDIITKKHPKIEIVNWTRSYFFWPGVEEIYGNIRISYTEYGRQSKTSSKTELVKGFLGIKQILDLPQLYACSFISSELIKRIKLKGAGRFYIKSIPDIYSTIEILQNSNEFLRIYRPLTLVGSSNSSLGIGNRIYKDSLDNSSSGKSLLNSKINFDLHQQKISAYYLLDVYLTFSDKHQQLPRRTYLLMAQIGVATELLRRGMLKREIQNFRIGAELLNFGRSQYLLPILISFPILLLRLSIELIERVQKYIWLKFNRESLKLMCDSSSKVENSDQAVNAILRLRERNQV